MTATDAGAESLQDPEEPKAYCKLDLAYFTEPDRCPLMVRRRARGAFELFLYLAGRFLKTGGEPVVAEHEELCLACGLTPQDTHSRSALSRLLAALRRTYRVIDYEPVRRRRPQIRLAPAHADTNVLNPRHYIYFYDGWSGPRRAVFNTLGGRAFAAEYMYYLAEYESALARVKHGRPYWFFPQEKIASLYHVSTRFAAVGLRALVDMGVMRIVYGQYGRRASHDEFGAANRYFFEGLGGMARRDQVLAEIQVLYDEHFDVARVLAEGLTNGPTAKNVQGICELLAVYGEDRVRRAAVKVAAMPTRSLKRRLGYLRALVVGRDDEELREPTH